ncbi:hypothetical protein [Sulfitobacter dubius]|jgi:hypothetical protein|uniref:hypothetical protein n=1 Tax=Sulfitobacter dubius TaxID=218673 RepID=UPI0022AFDA79|nr:hypothetical protein [Sulfitobacter dubius]MCZ4368596.1 hypothetical protein [Sulfitobacter dubius]
MTGISIGALIAPYVDMGQAYDKVLTRVLTESAAGDVMRMRPFQAIFSEGAAPSSNRLQSLIKHPTAQNRCNFYVSQPWFTFCPIFVPIS